jgi:hypothetical protein
MTIILITLYSLSMLLLFALCRAAHQVPPLPVIVLLAVGRGFMLFPASATEVYFVDSQAKAPASGSTLSRLKWGSQPNHPLNDQKTHVDGQPMASCHRKVGGLTKPNLSAESVGCSQLLDRIAMIESGNNPAAVGDVGRATGAWQMHAAARADARRLHGRAGTDRELAGALLVDIQKRLTVALGRTPTDGECYAVWNLGFSGFKRRGFDVAKCPAITRKAIARL